MKAFSPEIISLFVFYFNEKELQQADDFFEKLYTSYLVEILGYDKAVGHEEEHLRTVRAMIGKKI